MSEKQNKLAVLEERYRAAIREIERNTDLLWNRFNTFSTYQAAMIGLGILLTIQFSIIREDSLYKIGYGFTLLALSIIGFFITIFVWKPIHEKTREYTSYWVRIVNEYEKAKDINVYTEFFDFASKDRGLIRRRVMWIIYLTAVIWLILFIFAVLITIEFV